MKEELYIYFLSSYKYEHKLNEEFNYKFNSNYSIEKFDCEFNKLLYKLSGIFYLKNKYVTSFNSYDFVLPENMLKQVVKLYKYSLEKNIEDKKYILSDFLLSYYNTLTKNKRLDSIYKKAVNKYKKIMSEFQLSGFYRKLYQDCCNYYRDATKYGIDNDVNISIHTIHKIMSNIKEETLKNEIIKIMLEDDKYCTALIEYDSDIKQNKRIYLKFAKDILMQKSGFYDTPEVLIELFKKNMLTDKETKEIINLYVRNTNELCDKYKDKQENFNNGLSGIESLRKSLLEVLEFSSLNDTYKDKIRECIVNVLYLKRYLLNDDEYITSSMQEFSVDTTISDKKIEEFRNEIKNNKFKIYSASTINFDKCVESAIEFYSKYPLGSIMNGFVIDTNSQTYATNDRYAREYRYSFERYYEEIGRAYEENQENKLLNKLGKGYYIEMLRQLTRIFPMQQSILIGLLEKSGFEDLISELKKDQNFDFKNDYEIIVANIIATEININKTLSNNSIEYKDEIVDNLSLVFDIYKNDYVKRNGTMYLYYTLYECTGPNLRNKVMHGGLIGEKLETALLLSFCCLIISSWLTNEK